MSFFEKLKENSPQKEQEKTAVPKKEEKKKETAQVKEKKNLPSPDGQLVIDVYQTDQELVIRSAIAGIKSEDLEITAESDAILIKGARKNPSEEEKKNYFYQECYWGPFSRKIILPIEAETSKLEATMKDGILTIRIPKIQKEKKKTIVIKS